MSDETLLQNTDSVAQPELKLLGSSIENLRLINGETQDLRVKIEAGEPSPASVTLQNRMGSAIKRQLKRFLWWHSYQIKALTDLALRHNREEGRLAEALSSAVARLSQGVADTRSSVAECQRHVQDSDIRLRQVESVQARLQAAEVERNLRTIGMQLGAMGASLRQELNEVKTVLNALEARLDDEILCERTTLAEAMAVLTQRMEGEISERQQVAGRLSQLEGFAQQNIAALTQKVEVEFAQRGQIVARLSEVEVLAQQNAAASTERIEAESEQIGARLSELGLFTHQTRATLSIQERRLSLLMEQMRVYLSKPSNGGSQALETVNHHADHKYDGLYVAFEDAFRGSREDIKARQSIYLPVLKEHGIGSNTMPILDLGCGRGEWLELLGEHNLSARGLDQNEMMIEYCKSLGLDVTESDALSHLRTLPAASLGAVTSFHMIEHMVFDTVLALVDESLRVLRSGGILILETPNPENVLVGSYTFHLDPTHLKPLPSPMLQFFVEARGFCGVETRPLHPYPETVQFPDDGKTITARLNQYLYGPQDYAVIGRKP